MNQSNSLALILAAGKGTRMNQKVPKPIVKIYNRPIISWIIDSFKENGIPVSVIINPEHRDFFDFCLGDDVDFIYQNKQLGTGHAVLQANKKIMEYKYIYIFVGDSPFVDSNLISRMYKKHINDDNDLTILSSVFRNKKFPYARIVRYENGELKKIVEEINASKKELSIKELFCSHYLFKSDVLSDYIMKLKVNTKTNEINLTDIINNLIIDKRKVNSIIVDDSRKLIGLNTLENIKWAESQKMI